MKQKKKNKFLTWILSFIPGAAEMYMGFMKKGISLMGLFLLCIAVFGFFNMEIFVFVAILVWCYSFFHAGNIAASEEEVFASLQDDYIWTDFISEKNMQLVNPMIRKWGAWILIIFGVVVLWENLSHIIYRFIPDQMWDMIAPVINQIPEVAIALLLIFAGIRMIKGKKEELYKDAE